MANTSVLGPEVEVENSDSECAHEMQIEIKPASETHHQGERNHAPIRVGGRVRAPRAVYEPSPNYPTLAKQARISGDVVIDAVIDKTGSVVEMKVVFGPLPLIPAALAEVRTWRYELTYLNDEPIDIQFILTVRFELQN